jgi:hypothetical protein
VKKCLIVVPKPFTTLGTYKASDEVMGFETMVMISSSLIAISSEYSVFLFVKYVFWVYIGPDFVHTISHDRSTIRAAAI